MQNEVFSNHIGSASELTILADIKPGFVPVPEPLTYAARLRGHLRMLGALRRIGIETDRAGVYVGPVDSLRTLQYVRWTLVEDDTKMLLAVNFDRAFEPYVRRIVDIAGPLLDTIFSHCVGFEGCSSDQGITGFTKFAVERQVPVELFAAAAPNLSVDDGNYYLELDDGLRSSDSSRIDHVKMTITRPEEKLADASLSKRLAQLDQSLNILRIMYEFSDRFPKQSETVRDDLLFLRLTEKLLPDFREKVSEILPASGPAASTSSSREQERTAELLATFFEPLMWFVRGVSPRKTVEIQEQLPTDKIQPGLLPAGVIDSKIEAPEKPARATHAGLLLLRVDDAAEGRSFLTKLKEKIWPLQPDDSGVSYTVSITKNGLKSLGVPETVRRQFPPAFREGMAERAGLLGDTDCNHPKEWTWPTGAHDVAISPASIDLIVQVEISDETAPEVPDYDTEHPLFKAVEALRATAAGHSVNLMSIEMVQRRYEDDAAKGHLGFADGISQPNFQAKLPKEDDRNWDTPGLGELLLGHPTRLDGEELYPRYEAPLLNGTFQVVRKIKLGAAGFLQRLKDGETALDPDLIMEKMVGRRRNGENLQNDTGGNNFDYKLPPGPGGQDRGPDSGEKTPLQSHVRRANPREETTPRILRRGFSYGPYGDVPGQERGLMFIAYNANIAEQFEVIQRWISGGNSTGISSWHGDPLLAPKRTDGTRTFHFLHDNSAVAVDLAETPIGILQWGIYAFVPSQKGLEAIASGTYPELPQSEPVAPSNAATTLVSTEDAEVDQIREQIKMDLEDPDDENRHLRDAFWAEWRLKGDPEYVPNYGYVVAKAAHVREILANKNDVFSVSLYRERMEDTIGVQYLGVDDRGQHARESKVLSKFLNEDLNEQEMFENAREVALDYINALPEESQSLQQDGHGGAKFAKPIGKRLESKDFIHKVTAELSALWLGIPKGKGGFDMGGPRDANPHCPRDFLASSYYMFTPDPTKFNQQDARIHTPPAISALESFIAGTRGEHAGKNTLLGRIEEAVDQGTDLGVFTSDSKIAEYVAGSCFGLVGPVTGSFRSVFFDWIKEDQLWRLQQRLREQSNSTGLDAASQILEPAILASMSERPIADLLFRVTTEKVKLGNVEIPKGERVIFSQRSAVLDSNRPGEFLFGGNYNDQTDKAMHKCPGKTMGLAIMKGCFSAMMQEGTLWPEGPLSVWIRTSSRAVVA